MIFVVIIVIQRKRHRPLKIHCTNHIQISIWRSICLPFRLAIHRGFGNRFVGFAIHLRAIIKQLFCKKQFTKITTIATQHLPYSHVMIKDRIWDMTLSRLKTIYFRYNTGIPIPQKYGSFL